MRLEIKGFQALQDKLAQLRPAEIMGKLLQEQAQHLAETVQASLTEPVGAGDHGTPWIRTGALHDSIAATSDGLEAAVGSNDPAAAPQELGTSRLPPRPFLAPAAAAQGHEIAQAVGAAVADALRDGARTG